MADVVCGIVVIGMACFIFMCGKAYGHDRLRLDIIDACIERNPDMAHSKIREYCHGQFDQLGVK